MSERLKDDAYKGAFAKSHDLNREGGLVSLSELQSFQEKLRGGTAGSAAVDNLPGLSISHDKPGSQRTADGGTSDPGYERKAATGASNPGNRKLDPADAPDPGYERKAATGASNPGNRKLDPADAPDPGYWKTSPMGELGSNKDKIVSYPKVDRQGPNDIGGISSGRNNPPEAELPRDQPRRTPN